MKIKEVRSYIDSEDVVTLKSLTGKSAMESGQLAIYFALSNPEEFKKYTSKFDEVK